MFDQVKVCGTEACPEPVEGNTFMVLILVGWCPHGDAIRTISPPPFLVPVQPSHRVDTVPLLVLLLIMERLQG